MTRYRAAQKARRPVLGTRVDGREAARIIATLVAEGYLKREIATWLGHQRPVLHWRAGAGVTVRTTLRLRVIQRRVCT